MAAGDLIVGNGPAAGVGAYAGSRGAAFEPYIGEVHRADRRWMIYDIFREFLEGGYTRLAVFTGVSLGPSQADVFETCPGASPDLGVVTLDRTVEPGGAGPFLIRLAGLPALDAVWCGLYGHGCQDQTEKTRRQLQGERVERREARRHRRSM